MATKLPIYHATGKNLYARIFNATGLVYNRVTPAFEAPANTPTAYNVDLVESALLGTYFLTWPAVLALGVYTVHVFERVGGSPAYGDLGAGGGDYAYDGSNALVPLCLKSVVDGTMTHQQSSALAASVVAGNYADVRDTVAKTLTITYYRQDRTTVLCVMVTTYADADLMQSVSRSVTWSNLP